MTTSDRDALADDLGALPESRNVFDYTGEAATVINIAVDDLATWLLASDWLAAREAEAGARAVRDARDEIVAMLDTFAEQGRHTRARWAVAWLDRIIARAADLRDGGE